MKKGKVKIIGSRGTGKSISLLWNALNDGADIVTLTPPKFYIDLAVENIGIPREETTYDRDRNVATIRNVTVAKPEYFIRENKGKINQRPLYVDELESIATHFLSHQIDGYTLSISEYFEGGVCVKDAMIIPIVLDPGAQIPSKAHPEDAGYDLYAREDFTVPADGSAIHDTGVHIAVPEGYCGLIVSKSGLNVKFGLTSTGLLDSGYTGSLIVKLYNHNKGRDHVFLAGQKISQLVILPTPATRLKVVTELEPTARGNGGMGSTGK